jgi:hypothetical protein
MRNGEHPDRTANRYIFVAHGDNQIQIADELWISRSDAVLIPFLTDGVEKGLVIFGEQ